MWIRDRFKCSLALGETICFEGHKSMADTGDLNVAQDELGEDYNEDEIRLVRIKFLSEQAN